MSVGWVHLQVGLGRVRLGRVGSVFITFRWVGFGLVGHLMGRIGLDQREEARLPQR